MVIHNGGESLEVVISEKAVPEGLSLNEKLGHIPGQADQGCDQQPWQWSETLPQQSQLLSEQTEQQQRESRQNNGNRALGQNRKAENNPGRKPTLMVGISKTTPLKQKAEAEQSAEQAIAHGRPTPNQHQRRQRKHQGCSNRGRSWMGIVLLRPAQQGVGKAKHHSDAGERRRQARGPGSKRIPGPLAGNGEPKPHQPINQWRLVVTR